MEAFPTKVPDFVTLEHDVATILTNQELHGWFFDESAARELASTLYTELDGLTRVLRERHPFVAGSVFNPKRPNKTQGYFVGAESVRLKDANFTSRDHIAWIMQTFYDWKPTQFTDKGKATIDEVVLKEIGTPIALQFFRCLELTKQLGMLAEGQNAWLKLVKDGRIHHHCSVATNTHRCAHRKPNIAQIPSDEAMQRLWVPTPGMVMVGADLNAIELRMLAHYLARYDGGRYGDILLNDDIHQVNANKIGISRKLVKTVTYAFLYGAGDEKIGLSYDAQLPKNKAREKGKEIRAAYIAAIDGLDKLLAAVRTAGERGFVKAIDGRRIAVDSVHKALNYLLQSSAGVVAKKWMVNVRDYINEHNADVHQLAFIHDALFYETTTQYVSDLKFGLEYGAARAGEQLGMRCPVAAEGKSGKDFYEVH